MAANSIDSDQYVDGSIDTAHIADDAVTSAKLDTNIAIAGTLGSTGKITADAGIDIDNFNIDGTTIALSSGEMTIDVADNIKLDSGSGEIRFFDGGTYFGKIIENSGNLQLISGQQDKDILFVGNDNGSAVTALTLDMSQAGYATFNSGVSLGGETKLGDNSKLILGAGDDLQIYHDGSNSFIDETGTGNLYVKSNSIMHLMSDDIRLMNAANSETILKGVVNGAVTLYHDNVAQLRTANGHITVGSSSTPVTLGDFGEVNSYLIANSTSSSATLRFHVGGGAANKERARLDASGNLLVGQTSNSETGTGIGLVPDGTSHMYSGNTDALMLGRGGSDGEILSFNRSGSTVGSIGSGSGDLNINGPAGHSGIRFQASSILPRLDGADTDGTTDLGYHDGTDTHRFRNLYLAGGVVFDAVAGNATSNTLDDYEEGTWNPSFQSDGSTSYHHRVGTYTKVGNLVTAWFHLDIATNGAVSTQSLIIAGLPFAAINTSENYGAIGGMHCNQWSTSTKPDNALITPGANVAAVYRSAGQTGVYVVKHSDIGNGNMVACLTYRAA